MIKMIKFAYCDNCEKEVKPKRKSIEDFHINIWIFVIIFSLGFGIIPFLIYRYIVLKKNNCPNCNSQVKFFNSQEELPDPKSQIIRILKTIDDEKKEKELENEELKEQELKEQEFTFCPFCQIELQKHLSICPNCSSSLEK